MATGYELRCSHCGNRVEIVYGWYYNGGWGNPEIHRDIMDGKYGQAAIDAITEHPDALYHIEANPYQCKGHFIGSRDDLCIYSNDLSAPELYFKTKQKCPRCRKDMRPWKRAKPICPKCKNVMDSELMETWIE